MRVSFILWSTMAASLHLAAFDTNSQGIDTEIMLEFRNAKLSDALRTLQNKIEISLVYSPELIDLYDGKINLALKKRSIRNTLNLLLERTDLTYGVNDGVLVIHRKPAQESDTAEQTSLQQEMNSFSVAGKVTDSATQEPLAGVNIMVKGTTRGTSSDANGIYAIDVENGETLVFSFIGFKTLELEVNNRTVIDIAMIQDATTLETVQVISTDYFSTTKEKSTMNISKVEGKEIHNQPVTSLINTLVGRVPGLDITPNSGFPGRSPSIRIRGNNSLSGRGSFPLYVVDGVQIDSRPLQGITPGIAISGYDPLAGLNPNEIESIEVLKDAAATAIYGSRGANGVIRITTTRAKGQNKNNFDFNVYTGVGKIANKVELMNREQYLDMRREAYQNVGTNPGAFEADINGIWDTTRTTDWQDVLLGGSANITDVNGSFTGGSNTTSFKIGGAYHKENTVFPGEFDYQRASGDFSFNHRSIDNRFEIAAGINFGYTKNKSYSSDQFVQLALTLSPVAPRLYHDDGTLNWAEYGFSNGAFVTNTWQNPMAALLNVSDNSSTSIISNASIGYEIVPGLKIKSQLSLTNIYNDQTMKSPISAQAPIDRPYSTGTLNVVDNNRKSFMVEPQLSYARTVNDHTFNAIAGLTIQQARNIYRSIEGRNYSSDALLASIQGAKTVVYLADENNHYKYASAYVHFGYDYKAKYLFDLIGRRDGSSRFGPGKRYGNFGAVAVGWVFSEEELVKNNLSVLSFGKIRASYGSTGNDQIGDYQYLNTYYILPVGYQEGISLAPRALHNPNYAWEVTDKLEVASELGFIKNKLTLDVVWYRNVSSNQLVNYPLVAPTGFSSVTANFDATIENTGWEFVLSSKNIDRPNFKWVTSFNLSIPRNKLLSFDGIETSPYAYIYKVGEPLSIRRLFKYEGIDPETGQYQVKDVNDDGVMNDSDLHFMKPLGRTEYYGLSNTFNFHNVELSFLLQFSNNPQTNFLPSNQPGARATNQPVQMLDRWRTEGDDSKYQKYIPGGDGNYQYVLNSDFNTTDASFVRLKTLSLGYQIAGSVIQKVGLQQALIYLQGQNLLTLTKFKGLDPETGSAMPPLRILSVGLKIRI